MINGILLLTKQTLNQLQLKHLGGKKAYQEKTRSEKNKHFRCRNEIFIFHFSEFVTDTHVIVLVQILYGHLRTFQMQCVS